MISFELKYDLSVTLIYYRVVPVFWSLVLYYFGNKSAYSFLDNN